MYTADSEWTATNDQDLADYLAQGKSHGEISVLTGRTISAIATRAHRQGLTTVQDNRPWGENETALMHEMYAADKTTKPTYREVGAIFGRSRDAVRLKAQELGLEGRTEKTATEIALQKQSRDANRPPPIAYGKPVGCKYPSCPIVFEPKNYWDSGARIWRTKEYCHGHGPSQIGREIEQPKTKDESNGYHWSEEEDNIVKQLAGKATHDKIAAEVGRTRVAVSLRMKVLGLSREQAHKEWTVEELEFLNNNDSSMTRSKIAEHLGRSLPSVKLKAIAIGLKKYKKQTA